MLAAFCMPDIAKDEDRVSYRLRKIPKPTLNNLPPGSVLIKSVAASICGSDLCGRGIGSSCWRRPTDLLRGIPLYCGGSGHEVIGDIIEIVPRSSSQLCVGQRVLAMSPDYIRRVSSVRRVFEEETGTKAIDVLPSQGCFAEYFVSHACACLPVPKEAPYPGFDPLWFVVAQPVGTMLHAVQKLGQVLGQDIAIVGQGQNGLIMMQLLASMGARHIIALDLLKERLECSKKILPSVRTIQTSASSSIEAIKDEVRAITGGKLCDIAIDMVGHQGKTIDLCAQLTRDDGSVVLFGLPALEEEGDGFTIRPRDFYRNLKYVCSHSPGMETFQLAIQFLQQGRLVHPGPLITHYKPFQTSFPEAYQMASEYKDGIVKCILTFEGCHSE